MPKPDLEPLEEIFHARVFQMRKEAGKTSKQLFNDLYNGGHSDFSVHDPLECLAPVCSHVLGKDEQMVRHYGHYRNVSRGRRKKENWDALIPSILEPEVDSKVFRKNSARPIQKIYEAIEKTPKHLGLVLHAVENKMKH